MKTARPSQAMLDLIQDLQPYKNYRMVQYTNLVGTIRGLKERGLVEFKTTWEEIFLYDPGWFHKINQFKLTDMGRWLKEIIKELPNAVQ